MDETKNLEELTTEISNQFLDSVYILDILEEIAECDTKECFLISLLKNNVHKSFKTMEACRKLISFAD